MQHLLYRRNPTKRGECLIQILALGTKEVIDPALARLKRRKENVEVAQITNLKQLVEMQSKTLLTEVQLLEILSKRPRV